MQLTGKVIQILPEQTGEGKNGPWRKNRFVIEVPGQYPKKVAIDVWGEKWDGFNLSVNEEVTAFIDIESRQWQDKWFTDVKAWKVEKGASASASHAGENTGLEPVGQSAPLPEPPKFDAPAGEEPAFEDDLPF